MTTAQLSMWRNWRYDLPASLVVVLVALPLCLGIALASGAPLFSGLIAGVVGGIVVGAISKSPLSISGPAAGLTVIVLSAITELPSFEAFLLAVFLAGVIQIGLGAIRAGVVGDFIPSSVIKGMLAAIGIILILKQIPHAIGYDDSPSGHYSFQDRDGGNTFSALWHMFEETVMFGPFFLAAFSLIFLFWWDKAQPKMKGFLQFLPGPLVVVAFGVIGNLFYQTYIPQWAIDEAHRVAVPVSENLDGFLQNFTLPDFGYITDPQIWMVAFTLAIVASIETLLSVEAIDKLDPFKRVTPTNRELVAQGVGNMASGLIGGLPVTSVIVRSSANVSSGGRTKMAGILHGLLLFGLVVAIPFTLNLIPLSVLAAVLIAVGYKLAKPGIFVEKYQKGMAYFVPFTVTIAAILFTDLLIGIAIGVAVAMVFIVWENLRSAVLVMNDGSNCLVRIKKDLFFMHKYELKQALEKLPDGCSMLLDLTSANHIDRDNIDIINDFIASAPHREIRVTVKNDNDSKINAFIKEPNNAAL